MQITHPQAPYRGIPAEDMFFVSNDQQIQMGSGYLIPFVQRDLYPARPLNIYIEISAQHSARNMLFGALLARTEILLERYPDMKARIYAQLDTSDTDMQTFYQNCGFLMDDAEDMYYFILPYTAAGKIPMGVQYASVPLDTEQQQTAFLNRINAMRISPLTRDQLTLWRNQPGFLALGFYREGRPVSEILTSGNGVNASLIQVYTRSEFRGQGMASQLILQASSILRERGMTGMYAHIFRRNSAQVRLMQVLAAGFVRTVSFLPGADL